MQNISTKMTKRMQALVAEVEADAYARGRADARKELLEVLSARGARTPSPKISGARRDKKTQPGNRGTGGRKRAPRGSVPRFVERVLRDHPGSTVQEILDRAATDPERSIKLPSIRNELHSGRKQGKYESNARRWSLSGAGPGATDGGDAIPSDTSSERDAGESRGTLGLFS